MNAKELAQQAYEEYHKFDKNAPVIELPINFHNFEIYKISFTYDEKSNEWKASLDHSLMYEIVEEMENLNNNKEDALDKEQKEKEKQ